MVLQRHPVCRTYQNIHKLLGNEGRKSVVKDFLCFDSVTFSGGLQWLPSTLQNEFIFMSHKKSDWNSLEMQQP